MIPCRVCGTLFVPCNKSKDNLGAFNYREVACSPECGIEYLRRVEAARIAVPESANNDLTIVKETNIVQAKDYDKQIDKVLDEVTENEKELVEEPKYKNEAITYTPKKNKRREG